MAFNGMASLDGGISSTFSTDELELSTLAANVPFDVKFSDVSTLAAIVAVAHDWRRNKVWPNI
jgi:hypothetical protein